MRSGSLTRAIRQRDRLECPTRSRSRSSRQQAGASYHSSARPTVRRSRRTTLGGEIKLITIYGGCGNSSYFWGFQDCNKCYRNPLNISARLKLQFNLQSRIESTGAAIDVKNAEGKF